MGITVPPDEMCCMICFEENHDSIGGFESDEYGDWWTYCKKCDCWTSHPPKEVPITG